MEHIQPKDPNNGLQYQKTLLGTMLNISCLLKTPGVVESHGFFLNPSRSSPQEMKIQESNIHQVTNCCLFLSVLQYRNQVHFISVVCLFSVLVYGPVSRQVASDPEESAAAVNRDSSPSALVAGQLSAGQHGSCQNLGQPDARDLLPDVRFGCILPKSGRCAPQTLPAILSPSLSKTANL